MPEVAAPVRKGRPKKSEDVACTCLSCGKVYAVPGWQTYGRRYCSLPCYHAGAKAERAKNPLASRITRTCKECGDVFPVSPSRIDRPYCSPACSAAGARRRSRENQATVKTLTPQQAAYLAGFMDGEGSFCLIGRGNGLGIRLTAANTKRRVLEWIIEVTGVGAITTSRRYNPKHAQGYAWQLNSGAAVAVTEQLLPYLILKRDQAELILEANRRLLSQRVNDSQDWYGEFRAAMMRLNARGPQELLQ